jgi:hypothetical protein
MKRTAIIFVLFACITMSGCLVSALHPFYTAKDKVYDAKLVGNWMDDDSCLWIIQPNKSNNEFMSPEELDSTFNIVYYEDDEKAILVGTLFELDGKRYIDFTPDPDEDHCMSDMAAFHHVPVHTLARVDIRDDQVFLFWFGEEWLSDLFEENRIRIAHEAVDIGGTYNRQILTAPTEELQKFIIKYANAEDISKEIDEAFTNGTKTTDDHSFVILSQYSGPIPEN